MNTTVIKFDALSDTVGAAAKDHDLGVIGMDRVFVWGIVSGIVISTVRGTADMNSFPGFLYSQLDAMIADRVFWNFQKLA